jgi:nucleoid-associated protein YgaU
MRVRALWTAPALVAGVVALLSPGPAPCAAATAEHVVQAGDNLHLIAAYYFRDPRQWKRIWKANRKAAANPNRLVPGRVLRFETAPGEGWDVPYEEFRARVRGK